MSRGVKKLGAFWVKALRIWVYQPVITFLVTLWSVGGEWNAGKDLYAQRMGQRQGESILYGCCSIDLRLWLQAAVSTYSFIIQSNICALTMFLPHNFPPQLPTKSDKTEPLIHVASIYKTLLSRQFHFSLFGLLSCDLAKVFVEEEGFVFLLSLYILFKYW